MFARGKIRIDRRALAFASFAAQSGDDRRLWRIRREREQRARGVGGDFRSSQFHASGQAIERQCDGAVVALPTRIDAHHLCAANGDNLRALFDGEHKTSGSFLRFTAGDFQPVHAGAAAAAMHIAHGGDEVGHGLGHFIHQLGIGGAGDAVVVGGDGRVLLVAQRQHCVQRRAESVSKNLELHIAFRRDAESISVLLAGLFQSSTDGHGQRGQDLRRDAFAFFNRLGDVGQLHRRTQAAGDLGVGPGRGHHLAFERGGQTDEARGAVAQQFKLDGTAAANGGREGHVRVLPLADLEPEMIRRGRGELQVAQVHGVIAVHGQAQFQTRVAAQRGRGQAPLQQRAGRSV